MSTLFKLFARKKNKSKESEFEKHYALSTAILGKGAYAEVRLGQSIKTKKTVAVKIIDKTAMKPGELKKLHKEVHILKSLNHENIVKVYDAFDEPNTFYIVMEYINGGELFTRIVDEEVSFSEEETRRIVKTLAEALRHCKKRGVIHRDIKPENILLTSEEQGGQVKLVDFNLSKKLDPEAMNFSILETMCGTPNYVAPEVISGEPYDYKCDIWSLGVITFLLLSGGYLPFFVNPRKEGRDALLRKVKEGKWKFTPEDAWTDVSPMAKDFLTKLLRKDPEARYNYDQLLSHPWFKAEEDLMKSRVNMKEMKEFNKKRVQLKLQVTSTVKQAGDVLAGFMEQTIDDTFVNLRGRLEVQDSALGVFDHSQDDFDDYQ